jgi:hypothetical protein
MYDAATGEKLSESRRSEPADDWGAPSPVNAQGARVFAAGSLDGPPASAARGEGVEAPALVSRVAIDVHLTTAEATGSCAPGAASRPIEEEA